MNALAEIGRPLEGPVDFRLGDGTSLWKREVRRDFAMESFEQIPLNPPFSKGGSRGASAAGRFIGSLLSCAPAPLRAAPLRALGKGRTAVRPYDLEERF